ncbi:MAG TPA: hypothetical protein VMA98_10860 [Candidatus Acidoferrales bacterium]|nr:hypothetical protein [Candidatus Acidoferrales bacterium]
MKFSIAVLAVAAALLAAAPRAVAAPDPYEIWGKARAYWLQQRYPALIDYKVAVEITEGGNQRVERYDSQYDAVDGTVNVDPVSDYQLAHPVRPTGIDVGLIVWRNKPLPPVDWLGVPHLAPVYSFGMAPFVPAPTPTPFNSAALVAQIRSEFHDPNPRATSAPSPSPASGLEEIATVYAHNRDYTIVLLGDETIDGHACYHLALTPTHDPGRFRIRDAWIDEQSFATWQLQEALNFRSGPGTAVGWMIHFADSGDGHYISEEDALAPMTSAGEIFTKAAVRFENVVAASRARPENPFPQGGAVLEEPPP